jgi:hypothetical protein
VNGQCQKFVYRGRGSGKCSHREVRGGFCAIHQPDAIQERNAKKRAEWEAGWEQRRQADKERRENINRLHEISNAEGRTLLVKLGLYASGVEVPKS